MADGQYIDEDRQWRGEDHSLFEHSEDVVHPGCDIDAPHEGAVARVVHFDEVLDIWVERVPQVVDVGDVCQQVRHSCEQSHRDPNVAHVEDRWVGLPVVGVVFAGRAVVIGLEGAVVEGLFPVFHIHYAGACGVMTDQDVVAGIVVDRGVSVHDLCHNVSTDFGEGRTERDAYVCFEPAKARHELMYLAQVVPLEEGRLVKKGEQVRLGVLDVGDGSKTEVFVDDVFDDGVALAEGDVHLDGALTVADIMHFLFGAFVDVLKDGRKVEVSHVLEGELPELFVLVGVVFGVVAGVLVASTVAQPNVVALVGQHESRGLVLVVEYPSV